MSVYSLLKNYRNLENHKIKGIIQSFETLEFERYLILNFYEKEFYNQNLLKYQYCPIFQESLSFDLLLKENFFAVPSKEKFMKLREKNPTYFFLSKRRIFQNLLINNKLFLPLNNFTVHFEENI
jgi:hypothetical protein